MLPPEDTYAKFPLLLESCKRDLAVAASDVASPDAELRTAATETMRLFGELGKAIASHGPDSAPPPVDRETGFVGTLTALLPVLTKDAADASNKERQRLAKAALNELDAFAGMIAKASRQAGNRVA